MSGFMRGIGAPFRVIPWPVWLALLVSGAWLGRKWLLIAATIAAFHPVPIPPLFRETPRSLREAQLQDLDHFGYVRRYERSMTPKIAARFDAQVAMLRRQAGQLSEPAFMLGLARAQAIIDNAHSNASPSSLVQRFAHLPIRMSYFGNELRVLRATAPHRDLLGHRATHINGIAFDEVASRFRDAFGGNDANYRVILPPLLETPDYLNAVGVQGTVFAVRFMKDDGTSFERVLSTMTKTDAEAWTVAGDLPLFWRQTKTFQAFQPRGLPLYLREPDRGYWRADIPELDAVYVNLRTCFDDGSALRLSQFVRDTIDHMRAQTPRVAIIDLRFNHGGDYSLTHPLMAELGNIVGTEGRTYFLTSGNTFSAAIVSIAFAKQAAPERTIIVGDDIGDRLQFWAEGWRFDLPNSGFRARYSTAYYDLEHGCSGLFRCYWGAFHLFPVIVDSLKTDISAPLTFDAYQRGLDPALEAVRVAETSRSGRR